MGPRDQPIAPPSTIEHMAAAGVDELLTRLERDVPVEPPLLRIAPPSVTQFAVIGDTHGDWRSTEAAASWFLDAPGTRAFVGLGDYVDRAPPDCPAGSAVNALWLLGLKAAYPDRIFLLQGNHEATLRVPVLPHSLPDEMERHWGPDPQRYGRLIALLERSPLAAYTPNGVYLAHGGFPIRLGPQWTERFETVDEALVNELLWRDAAESNLDRGVPVAPFTEQDLRQFLSAAGLSVFLRGHDPQLVGVHLDGDRCLTLHTSRVYEQFGGILVAHVPMGRPVGSLADLEVVRLRVEPRLGRRSPD